ncbi:alpha/beta hydrolase [Nesterenkonia populi]|uniref:alpha/beta hydrolase n=1 Tax=Nesterenkonia populi TaxID=1591087 RepID=UPI0011BE7ACD|nr:alpha/beta hydrolase [Nesterenkonia populi]
MHERPRPSVRWAASALLLALGLSACAGPGDDEPEDGPAGTQEAPGAAEEAGEDDERLSEFYDQELTWEDCGTGMQCTDVAVPVDYEDPEDGSLELAVVADSTDPELDYVLTNPGGPGESGVDMVTEQLSGTVSEEVRDQLNVVGFDPRGVHRSEGVECMTDEEMDEYRELEDDPELDADTAFGESQEQAAEIGEQCAERTGDLLAHVDTFSAARDMDIIRGALDQNELHYMGFSYGTKLGMAYAELFPEQVGRFALDAMMDVTNGAHELTVAQGVGFEDALEGFAEWCVEDEQCPIAGTPEDVVETVQQMFADVDEEPVTVEPEGRTVNASMLVSGFIAPMYSPEGWPHLAEGLQLALEEDDYYAFMFWADQQAGRTPAGEYDWMSSWAFRSVMCLDYEMASEQEEIEAELEELTEQAPTFGPYLGHSGVLCSEWPHEPVSDGWEPGSIAGRELPEMLMVGTTGDPATPVQWAEQMHEAVPASSLITYEGEGHVAYRPGNECVTDIVDAWLVEGELDNGRHSC